jgi:hypothetical protein
MRKREVLSMCGVCMCVFIFIHICVYVCDRSTRKGVWSRQTIKKCKDRSTGFDSRTHTQSTMQVGCVCVFVCVIVCMCVYVCT